MFKVLAGILVSTLMSGFAWGQLWEGGRPQAWVDQIGEKYSGPDKDLSGFKIVPPETACDSMFRKCVVTWNNSKERDYPKAEVLKSYTIYFEVLNRKKDEILEKSYKWDKDIRNSKEGYDGSVMAVAWGGIDLNYTIVNYWVQDIKWIPKAVAQKAAYDGPQAFTLEDQLKGLKKKK